MKNENVTFKKLQEAFKNKGNHFNIALIRQLLYDFSYEKLSTEYSDNSNDIDSIRKGIFNFLYSGNFDEEINETTKKYFKNILENHLIDKLKEAQESDKKEKIVQEITAKLANLPSWDEFYAIFETQWTVLSDYHKKEYLEKLEGEIRHFVVYEAPPPCQKDEKISEVYFLMSNKDSYATTIKKCFNAILDADVCKFMAEHSIGYFDLIMAPMPLSSDVRKKWSKEPEWKIDGKQLPVVLFELGIAHLILKGKSIESPMFAIGTPALTSTSIFEYYSDKLLKVWKHKTNKPLKLSDILFGELDNQKINEYEPVFTSNLSITNSQTTHKIRGEDGKGMIFPLFKSNVISGSNYLSESLMRNAFDKF